MEPPFFYVHTKTGGACRSTKSRTPPLHSPHLSGASNRSTVPHNGLLSITYKKSLLLFGNAPKGWGRRPRLGAAGIDKTPQSQTVSRGNRRLFSAFDDVTGYSAVPQVSHYGNWTIFCKGGDVVYTSGLGVGVGEIRVALVGFSRQHGRSEQVYMGMYCFFSHGL